MFRIMTKASTTTLHYPTVPEVPFKELKPVFPKQLRLNGRITLDEMPSEHAQLLSSVQNITEQVLNSPIHRVRIADDELYGTMLEIYVVSNARTVLNGWGRLIDVFKQLGINVPIFLKWVGELDVSPEELGRYLGLAFAKMNLKLRTREPIDVTKIVSESRGM